MELHGISRVADFIERFDANSIVFDDVIAALTVPETYFFRDPAQFDAIRTVVLPSLLQSRPEAALLNIWSAGCSTGEEAYSLSILMEEEGLGDRARILATDISRRALREAQAAEYGEWSYRDTDRRRHEPFLQWCGTRFRVAERVRRRVEFGFLNLAAESYPSAPEKAGAFDLILCRNVFIYMDEGSVRQIAQRLFASLADGGWLIIGSSDPPLWNFAPFETVITPGGVIYQRCEQRHDPEPTRRTSSRKVSARPATGPARPEPPVVRASSLCPPSLAKAAYAAGDCDRVKRLTEGSDEPEGHVLRIRALSETGDLPGAEQAADAALAEHPLCPELHFLRSLLFLAREKQDSAVSALHRTLDLDPSLAAAHLLLGTLLQHTDRTAALKALVAARNLCAARPVDDIVPLTRGETAGRLAETAQTQIAIICRAPVGEG